MVEDLLTLFANLWSWATATAVGVGKGFTAQVWCGNADKIV